MKNSCLLLSALLAVSAPLFAADTLLDLLGTARMNAAGEQINATGAAAAPKSFICWFTAKSPSRSRAHIPTSWKPLARATAKAKTNTAGRV
jgi:hypothetical protein